jgi:hypothetical protein
MTRFASDATVGSHAMYIGLLVSQSRQTQEYSPHHADMPALDVMYPRHVNGRWQLVKGLFRKLVQAATLP